MCEKSQCSLLSNNPRTKESTRIYFAYYDHVTNKQLQIETRIGPLRFDNTVAVNVMQIDTLHIGITLEIQPLIMIVQSPLFTRGYV